MSILTIRKMIIESIHHRKILKTETPNGLGTVKQVK